MAAVAALVCYLASDWSFPWIYLALPLGIGAGWLLWPHNRHANRERYRGTRWRVLLAMFLSVGLMLGQTIAAFGLAMSDGQPITQITLAGLIAAALATCTAAVFAMFIAYLRGDETWSLGLVRRDLGPSVWLGLRTGLLFLGMDLLGYKISQTMDFWQLSGTNVVRAMFETDDHLTAVVTMIFGVILVPFAEEVLFRGVLFAALRRSSGVFSAVAISSIIFGLFHYPGWGFPTALGVLLALIYHRTGSLWGPVAAHMLVNIAGLGLGFNRGSLLRHLSWTDVGVLILLIGFLQLIPGRRSAAGGCTCGASAPDSADRCPVCAYPLADWPATLTLVGRLGLAFVGVVVGGGAIAFDMMASRPYAAGSNAEVVALQYELLRGNGRETQARALIQAWHADQPDAPGPQMALAQDAYMREDYAAIVKLMEPLSRKTGEEHTHTVRMAKNILALALAELGGPAGEEAVRLARQVLDESPEENKKNVEDTLGWALVRVGQLEEARMYLDRELVVYGLATRAGIAELAYHRGVLLWSIGEEERARQALDVSARLVPPVEPFSRRSKQILDRGCLPEGLVPSLPPPLPEPSAAASPARGEPDR